MEQEVKNNWLNLFLIMVIVIFTAVVIGGSIYYVMDQQIKINKAEADSTVQDLQGQINEMKKAQTSNSTSTTIADPTSNWKTYTDSNFGFSFKYPSDFVVIEGKSEDNNKFYMLSINKVGTVTADGMVQENTSFAYIYVGDSKLEDDKVIINGLSASYYTDVAPLGYTLHTYGFAKGLKSISFNMNDYSAINNNSKSMTLDQFKTMVGTYKVI